jgi:hypothetical protein
MTNELKNQIRNELHKAFAYCGETDAVILNNRVEDELETLMCFMVGSNPDVVQTDKGELTGYLVNIAVGSGKSNGEIVALQMIVAKNEIYYILHSHITVKPDGWKPGDKKMIENESNRVVELTDIDAATFN